MYAVLIREGSTHKIKTNTIKTTNIQNVKL